MATEGTGERSPTEAQADELAELRTVIAKARAGDASVVPRLRTILANNPALVGHYGDIARQAEGAWVALAAGPNLFVKESLARAADARRTELTRPGATAVEKLLVERIVACWLQTNYFSAHEADRLAAGDTFRQLQFHAKRLERAQRMYLAALGALLTFQKLMPVPNQETLTRELASCAEERQQPRTEATAAQADRAVVSVEVDEPSELEPAEQERVRVWAGG